MYYKDGLQNTTNQSQTDASFPVNTNSDPLSSSKFDATISQVSVLNTSINSQPEVKLQTGNLSTTTLNEIHISGSGQGPIISQNQRPAAAVIPIQQQSVCTQAEKPVLSMATASSVSFAPQINPVPVDAVHNLPVSDVVDPVKFQLGIGDRTRLEKRLLHESIRKEGPRPPLDPTDPLNMLDPFWNTR
uniref:WH2 domain-containing protein n=1 Tax=Heterorhabditis bacteriophora TaxID=37862 RepID=A0A1I7W8B9_HETBA